MNLAVSDGSKTEASNSFCNFVARSAKTFFVESCWAGLWLWESSIIVEATYIPSRTFCSPWTCISRPLICFRWIFSLCVSSAVRICFKLFSISLLTAFFPFSTCSMVSLHSAMAESSKARVCCAFELEAMRLSISCFAMSSRYLHSVRCCHVQSSRKRSRSIIHISSSRPELVDPCGKGKTIPFGKT